MEDITQSPINQAAELLKSLAKEHQVPVEIADQMAFLMERYPDLSLWGSKAALIENLETVIESAFSNRIIGME